MKSRPPPQRPQRPQPEVAEIELIRSLYLAFMPSAIMTAGFITSGAVIVHHSGDLILLGLLIAGGIASCARLAVAWTLAPMAARERLTLREARQLERHFAVPYLSFAILLGMFGLRAFMLPSPQVHMVTICLLIGYCAGVAVGMGMRLWIAVPAMLLSTVPGIFMALATPDPLYWVMSLLVVMLLAGGAGTLKDRHARCVKDIALRQAFANLARKDALTELPNRIALKEWYEQNVLLGDAGLIAVHYIDLNGFKPVNDTHGHPVGDELLNLVGKRIVNTIRETDIAARLGGDEFVVIQHGLTYPNQAEMLGSRLCEAIACPYRIGKDIIRISAGLGYVVAHADDQEDLEHLLTLADEALYASKRSGNVTQYEAVEALAKTLVA